jgi:hypothetical protein
MSAKCGDQRERQRVGWVERSETHHHQRLPPPYPPPQAGEGREGAVSLRSTHPTTERVTGS